VLPFGGTVLPFGLGDSQADSPAHSCARCGLREKPSISEPSTHRGSSEHRVRVRGCFGRPSRWYFHQKKGAARGRPAIENHAVRAALRVKDRQAVPPLKYLGDNRARPRAAPIARADGECIRRTDHTAGSDQYRTNHEQSTARQGAIERRVGMGIISAPAPETIPRSCEPPSANGREASQRCSTKPPAVTNGPAVGAPRRSIPEPVILMTITVTTSHDDLRGWRAQVGLGTA